jgi:hypothetical protein
MIYNDSCDSFDFLLTSNLKEGRISIFLNDFCVKNQVNHRNHSKITVQTMLRGGRDPSHQTYSLPS